ncbi:MAG: PD40 domain-containing protein [Gemmatimonadetes bacterium]|nr:PD40 domain-containing protein [Gemmatimonadota bacterium]
MLTRIAAVVLLTALYACDSPTGPSDKSATLEAQLPWDRLHGRLAFITDGCGGRAHGCAGTIHIADVGSRSVRELVQLSGLTATRSVVFAPDGGSVTASVFSANPAGDNLAYRLVSVALDDPEPVLLRPDPPFEHQANFGWSRDGRLALVRTVQLDDGTYRSDAITVDDLVLPPVDGWPAGLSRITWSPDGSEIVMAMRTQRPAPLLYAISVPAGIVTDLMADAYSSDDYASEPDYSPDGARIAYTESTGGAIWLVDRESGTRTRLTIGNDRAPIWAPDGSMVLFIRDGQPHIADVGTGAVTRLTRQQVTAAAWAW